MTDEEMKALLLRLPPELHRDLKRLSLLERRSLNSQILILIGRGLDAAKRRKGWANEPA